MLLMGVKLPVSNMKKRVLVIEDEPVIAEMVNIILQADGYKVISLSDFGNFKVKVRASHADVVLLDINLAGFNGRDICEYIKSQSDLKHIPVIILSANNAIQKIQEESGADDFIKKPFDLDYFINKIHSYTHSAV
ncbi:MAG: response regulator [Mucilaginibacter sp.]|nr:response regulator [Mucilaginibacter sp.]